MKYKIFYEENSKLKNKIFNATSLEELTSFNSLPLNIIKIKELKTYKFDKFSFVITNENEILELFYEMSIMLEAKLPIKDVVDILGSQET